MRVKKIKKQDREIENLLDGVIIVHADKIMQVGQEK